MRPRSWRPGAPPRSCRCWTPRSARTRCASDPGSSSCSPCTAADATPKSLRTYQQLRTTLVDELGLDPSPSLQRLQERILLHDPSLLPQPEQPAPEASHRNPYKGLRSFTEADAPDFFGRDALVERLIGALESGSHLVALVGPSGSGKSSAIAAGLIPRLRDGAIPGSDRWVIAQMVPGTNPLAEVEAVVAAAAGVPTGLATLLDAEAAPDGSGDATPVMPEGSRVLLVIDQFEELFTITDEVARRRFLDSIARAVSEPDTQITVLLSLRADYYDRPLLHPEFAKVFTPGVENALPMTANELEAVVVGPAERGGVAVEPPLLAELVADAADRPGTLPLLEFALTELFDQRTQAALTLDGYRALGGIRGVLSRSAEAIYDGLRTDEQRVAMQVFLHLVQLGVGTTESRRRLPLADLTGLDLDPVALSAVLEAFGRRRLLSFDRESTTQQATVEVAHESLFREWDRLAGWIDRHRSALQRYEALMAATDEWQAADRHADYLLTGTRLAEFETWIDDASVQITGRQREFIAAGLERRSAEQEAERSRVEAERRMERRARTRLLALAGVVVLAIGSVGYAIWAGLFTETPHVALLHAASARSMPFLRRALIGPSPSSAWSGRTRSSTTIANGQPSSGAFRRVAPTSSCLSGTWTRSATSRATIRESGMSSAFRSRKRRTSRSCNWPTTRARISQGSRRR